VCLPFVPITLRRDNCRFVAKGRVQCFQLMGNHGIVFSVLQVTLTDNERGRLRELHIGEARSAHYAVNSKVVEVYDKMQAESCLA
jgi:hypothetical protein